MAGVSAGRYSYNESGVSSQSRNSNQKHDRGGSWYFGRKEIEDNSPSRLDGIDLKKETYLRKSYCAFLQDLGMRLKVPQLTIATAVIFCHRFFIRQSHARNNNKTIATACMFLAGKVEETPRPLKDVILVSYEIMHKKDPATAQKIKQKEVYEEQKELILSGEKIVLSTLGFECEVYHPYKPLVDAIKKFKVAQNTLAQVAWNFVNDGLRTSLCLQFKPHHIAAGAIFLAAKFLKVKLPSEGEKVWWQEFDITPRQLEDVSNQMLELYDQNCVPASQGNEVESSVGGGGGSAHYVGSRPISEAGSTHEHSNSDNHGDPSKATQNRSNGSGEASSVITEQKEERNREAKDSQYTENHPAHKSTKPVVEVPGKDKTERRDAHLPDNSDNCRNGNTGDAPISQTPKDIKLLKDKVKARREAKRSQGERWRKKDSMDEDDLIERELEDVELSGEDDKDKQKKNSNINDMGEKQVEGGKRWHSKSEKVEEGYKRSRREGSSQSHGDREPRSEKVEERHKRSRREGSSQSHGDGEPRSENVEGYKRSRREGSSHSHDDREPRRYSQDRR